MISPISSRFNPLKHFIKNIKAYSYTRCWILCVPPSWLLLTIRIGITAFFQKLPQSLFGNLRRRVLSRSRQSKEKAGYRKAEAVRLEHKKKHSKNVGQPHGTLLAGKELDCGRSRSPSVMRKALASFLVPGTIWLLWRQQYATGKTVSKDIRTVKRLVMHADFIINPSLSSVEVQLGVKALRRSLHSFIGESGTLGKKIDLFWKQQGSFRHVSGKKSVSNTLVNRSQLVKHLEGGRFGKGAWFPISNQIEKKYRLVTDFRKWVDDKPIPKAVKILEGIRWLPQQSAVEQVLWQAPKKTIQSRRLEQSHQNKGSKTSRRRRVRSWSQTVYKERNKGASQDKWLNIKSLGELQATMKVIQDAVLSWYKTKIKKAAMLSCIKSGESKGSNQVVPLVELKAQEYYSPMEAADEKNRQYLTTTHKTTRNWSQHKIGGGYESDDGSEKLLARIREWQAKAANHYGITPVKTTSRKTPQMDGEGKIEKKGRMSAKERQGIGNICFTPIKDHEDNSGQKEGHKTREDSPVELLLKEAENKLCEHINLLDTKGGDIGRILDTIVREQEDMLQKLACARDNGEAPEKQESQSGASGQEELGYEKNGSAHKKSTSSKKAPVTPRAINRRSPPQLGDKKRKKSGGQVPSDGLLSAYARRKEYDNKRRESYREENSSPRHVVARLSPCGNKR